MGEGEAAGFKNEQGFELIAEALGVPRPTKVRGLVPDKAKDFG